MQRGIAAPILILMLGLFAVVVMSFVFFPRMLSDKNSVVKGVATSQETRNGFSVIINSNGTWDLFEYLCEDITCKTEIEAGKKYATISGGETTGHEVIITYSPDFSNYKFVKLMVKPGWGSVNESYNIEPLSGVSNSGAEIIRDSAAGSNVLLIPIEVIATSFTAEVAAFSNR